MDACEQKSGSFEENKQFLSQLYTSKEDFLREYTNIYYGQTNAEELYLQILHELVEATSDGNFDTFKKLSNFICYISDIESVATLRAYYGNVGNPIKNTNLVILACKHNQVGILKYLFTDQCLILNKLTIDIGRIAILPEDKDATCHNAFYYAIRTSNVELINTLINNYFVTNLEELTEILAIAYSELRFKNVPLTDEIAIFVESKLINHRFYSNNSGQVQDVAIYVSNIKERIGLVLDNIRLLNSNVEEVDEIFLFIAKFIAHNIHILKQQLKSTYDRLPWEEIEFCLIIFISSHVKQLEMNLFCDAVLDRRKIMKHLDIFAKVLEDERNNIDSADITKLVDLPKLNRDEVIAKIIGNCPEFEELYNDYQQIRDIHSLDKISNYIKLALSVNPRQRDGQLIVMRALQVIGEYFKNSLESPKLSNSTSELLLLSLPRNTRLVIIDLRNSLSHANSLSQRTEIEENADVKFFINVQIDIIKINSVITDMLYKNKIITIRILLTKFLNSESLAEIKEVAKSVSNVGLDKTILGNVAVMEYENIEKLIKKLNDFMPEKTSYEEELFYKINKIIDIEKTKLANVETDFNMALATLKSCLCCCLSSINIDNEVIRIWKYQANKALENITQKIESASLKEISELSSKISHSIMSRLQPDKLDEAKRLIYEIFYFVQFGIENNKWIEELRIKFNEKSYFIVKYKNKNMYNVVSENYDKQVTLKLTELKNIYSLKQNFSCYRNNRKMQAVIEMLVLDVMSILGGSMDYLENNLGFLDEISPTLTGKCLRNHLAHDNPLFDVLLSDPSIAIILNAEKLAAENIIVSEKKIGQSVIDDPSKLKNKYDEDLAAITNQKKMFTALEEGNLENFKNCLEKGADLNARSVNSWTALHFAAKGSSLEVIKFIVNQNLGVDVTDVNSQSPLHIAAAYGRSANIIEFLIGGLGLVGNVDDNGDTPLHIAAQNGHKDTVIVLLKNKANTVTKNKRCLPPLHCALENNYIDVVKILLEQNVDINEAMGGYTPLYGAAERGNLELVNFLVRSKASVNAKNDKGWTALHAAALNGHLKVVNVLISRGSVVNARASSGCTPLHYAVKNSHKKIVDVLLRHGVNVNVADKTFKNTALHYAAQHGNEAIVKSLLKFKANANVATVGGMTPLHFAAHKGHLETIVLLLEHGVNINAKNKSYNTPLHYAAENGHTKCVELLIKNKANVNLKTDTDLTTLHIAALSGHEEIVNILLRHKSRVNVQDVKGDTPLHLAATNGNREIINVLIQNDAKINARNNNGVVPLHVATITGNRDIVDLFIKYKANVHVICKNGFSPLYGAIIKGYTDIVSLLIKHKVAVNATGISDFTPLHSAIEAGYKDVVKILIANGANVNVTTKDNLTPLSSAIKHNHKDIVAILLANGAKVNAPDSHALRLAVLAGYTDIVEILLQHNADIGMKYNENITILHLAASGGHMGIVDALIRKGADVNALTIHNVPPLYLAAQKGHEDIVELLILNGASMHFGNSPLHIAAGRGHNNVIKVLLTNGPDINSKDYQNRTAIELAVRHGHIRVIKTLLQHKDVHINAKCNDNLTILHIAAEIGNLEIIRYLVEKGADINAKNIFGSKPIHIAARNGYKNIVEFFLDNGLSINETDLANQTLLHYTAIEGKLEVIEYLINKDVDLNTKDAYGSTALHIAANQDCMAYVEVLLKNGAFYNVINKRNKKPIELAENNKIVHLLASIEKLFKAVKQNSSLEVKNCVQAGVLVNAKNCDGATPLHFAAWKGYDEIVDVLLQNHADINAIGDKKLTPLHYAAKFSHLKIVKALLSNGALYNPVSNSGKTPLDFGVDVNITGLLKLVSESFKNVQNGECKVINDLTTIEDIDTMNAIMNARNMENKTLVVIAMINNFPKVEQLKQILQDDLSAHLKMTNLLLAQENYQEALNIFRIVLEKRRTILGPDNPGTLDIQVEIAKILCEQQEYEESLSMFEDIYQKLKVILGTNHEDTLNTRSSIALVLHRQDKNKEALEIYEDIYKKQMDKLGTNHSDVLATQTQMALVLDKQNKYGEALSVHYEVLEKWTKTLGANHPSALTTQYNIAMVLNNQGKYDEASEMYQRVYEARKLILGRGHSDTLRALHNKTGVLIYQTKYDEALKTLKEVFNAQKAVLGSTHIGTLNTQTNIANLLLSQGKYIGAFKNYKESLDARKAILGSDHPHILDTENSLKMIDYALTCEDADALQYLQKDINIAANDGDVQTVDCLLKYGADVNDPDVDGRTPIHFASINGDLDVVKMLLRNKADVTQSTDEGITPLHIATSKGYKEIVDVFLQDVTNRDTLNNFINAQTRVGGTTSLHVAAKNGFLEIVKLLLKYGATYDIKNKESKTPLNVCKNEIIIHLLTLTEGLFTMTKNGNTQVIDKLSLLKSDELIALTNARNNEGNTLLQVAITNKHTDIAHELLQFLKTSKIVNGTKNMIL